MREFFINADGINLHAKLERPSDEKSPLVILLHGLTGHMEERHIVAMANTMIEAGYAVLRVELYGHGKSDGEFCNHTLYKWINNVLCVIDYAKELDWVTDLYLSGHSQGGYTTMLVAGMRPDDLAGIMPLSPAIVIERSAQEGSLFGMTFDPAHVPDRIYVGDLELAEQDPEAAKKQSFSGDYFRVAQMLHVNEAIDRYPGPVLIVHGDADVGVPLQDSIDAAGRYANAQLAVIPGDTHCYDYHLDLATQAVREFLEARR